MAISLRNNIKPIFYIKSHEAEILKYVNETKNPMIITKNGEGKEEEIKQYAKNKK